VIAKKKGRGTLIAIGGNEDRRNKLEVLRRVIDEAKGSDTYVEVVTTASRIPRELERTYGRAFNKIGVKKYDAINIAYREEAFKERYVERVKEADVVFFTGGDQLRLTNILGDSDFLRAVRERFENGAVIAGTSAGAAALSDTMIYRGESKYGLVKNNVSMRRGFEFVENIAFDTHCIGRGRILRLFQAVAQNPDNIGIGLSEDTAVVMHEEHIMEVVGNGTVVVVEGSHLRKSNIDTIKTGDLIAVENFYVHSFIAGYKYDLEKRKVIAYPRKKPSRRS
jgi:cyanophycinase